MKKRGQVTIFIIMAILVVAIVAIFFMVPKLREGIVPGVETPENFIQTCLEDVIEENVEIIALQGGSYDPEFYYLYEDNKLQYLCYTGEYYDLCTIQIPFLRGHIEDEIKNTIETDVDDCFISLKESYKDSSLQKGEIKVDLLPERIITTMNYTFTFTKTDTTERHETFRVVLNNNLYELVAIAQNIVEWETTYGGADPDSYMDLYDILKVEKYEQTDETTVYIITDKNKGDKFQFASRSLAFSPLD